MPGNTSNITVAAWVGRALTALVSLFLAFDSGIKLISHEMAVGATQQLGYAASHVPLIGVIGLVGLLLYLFPKTSMLGAVLITGQLGGALATHLRAGSEPFAFVFAFIIGAMVWGGLYLRNAHVRKVMPLMD